jgi:flavorubredoxin
VNSRELNYSDSIQIADGVHWVGFADKYAGFHCNPYLIVDHDEAALIDSGGRNDFSTVMLKIMRTGANPHHIIRLIYQHHDPDLCGNIPHMEAIIGVGELKIISHSESNHYIEYYSTKSPKQCIEELNYTFAFSSGRQLRFIPTPYAHSPGSFVTYDTATKTLFSSDIFGAYDTNWSLYSQIGEPCVGCVPEKTCPHTNGHCQLYGILDFHKRTMTSVKALRYALDRIEELDIALIAPQHGSILDTPLKQKAAISHLQALTRVGFECFIEGCDS